MRWVAERKERLDLFLVARIEGASRTKITRLIESGGVTVNGQAPSKAGFELRPGYEVEALPIVEAAPHSLEPIPMTLEIMYEDEVVMVVNKPRGLSVHPGAGRNQATLVHGLLARGQGLSQGSAPFRPGIVHRLDKDTTGLIMVAKSDAAHTSLSAQIKSRTVDRRYLAVVRQLPELGAFTIDAPVGRDPAFPLRMKVVEGGRRAVTHVRVLRRLDRGVLTLCKLDTGRTHQIRIHMAHYGYEVLGDRLYATPPFDRGPLQLHAAYLAFRHPVSGSLVECYCSPPADFLGVDSVTEHEVRQWT